MKEEQQSGKTMPGTLNLAVSIITHFLLIAPVIYIVVLASVNYKFFSWHPICMAVGVGLVMMEAVFAISGEANLNARVSRMSRITVHWTLLSAGLTLMIIGLIIIVVNKKFYGKVHFKENHAKLGLSAIVLSFVVATFGIVANNTRWLYPRVRPVLIKVGHAFGGIAMTILLLATVINGTYTKWFEKSGSDTGRDLVFASLFFAGMLILAKPVLGAVSRSRVIFKSSKPNIAGS